MQTQYVCDALGIQVKYITDIEKIRAYVVISMPVISINEQVVDLGGVLTPAAARWRKT